MPATTAPVSVTVTCWSGWGSACHDDTQRHTGHGLDLRASPLCSRGGRQQAGGSLRPRPQAEAPSHSRIRWLQACPRRRHGRE